jgi:hippurate hydrolase
MGAEDFSYVLQQIPGAMAFVGVAPDEVDPAAAAPCHSNRMLLNEEAMANGVALHAAVAHRFLNN